MNKTTRYSLLATLVFGALACGSKDTASPDKSAAPKGSGSAKAAPEKSGAAGATSAKPTVAEKRQVEIPKYETREKKPLELGGQKLTATVCAFDTRKPMPDSDSFSSSLQGLAIGPDDSIWLVDAEGAVRHYTNQDPAGCELVLDDKFGTGGVLVPEGKAEERIGVDKNGVVYVNTGNGPVKIVNGKVEKLECSHSGRVSAGRESDQIYVDQYVLKDGKCDEKLELKGWVKDPFTEILGVEKDGLDVKGTFEKDGKHIGQAAFHDFSGERKIAVGKEDGDEDIYYTHDVFGCPMGLCVVDGNASSLRVWKKDGAFVGKVNVDDLTGVETFPKHGEFAAGAMWIGGSADKPEPKEADKPKDEKPKDDKKDEEKKEKNYLPFLARVTAG